MLQTSVQSSNIKSVAWQSDTLYITFHSGCTYRYEGVRIDTYNALVEAPSVGKFFHSDIKPNYVATLKPNEVTPT